MMTRTKQAMSKLKKLVDVIARLRAPGGCPWDREQTHESLKGALLEEACEVIVEIEQGNMEGLKDELGDLLLHVVFHAQIAQEARQFSLEQVIDGVVEKLVRRHPHVFGNEQALTPTEVKQTWERVKKTEGNGTLKVSKHLPALIAARKLQDRAENAQINLPMPIDPHHLNASPHDQQDPELVIGQLLFAVVALAREKGVEPEWALAKLVSSTQQHE